MECMDFAVSLPGLSLNLVVIYRSPYKSVLSFANDFLDYIWRGKSTQQINYYSQVTLTVM